MRRREFHEYVHRACKSCGKRIPRWTEGKATPVTRVFCDDACRSYHHRLYGQKRPLANTLAGVTETPKKRPVSSAFAEPVCAPIARPEWAPCLVCERMQPAVPGKATYCNDSARR
jgi:hypothetical protein